MEKRNLEWLLKSNDTFEVKTEIHELESYTKTTKQLQCTLQSSVICDVRVNVRSEGPGYHI